MQAAKEQNNITPPVPLAADRTPIGQRHIVSAEFRRDGLRIHLRINRDALTAAQLEALSSSEAGGDEDATPLGRSIKSIVAGAELLSRLIESWDLELGEPTLEMLLDLPVGLLTDLQQFCLDEICGVGRDDLTGLRRYLMTGGLIGHAPEYYWDIHDARLLNMKPWEMAGVPLHWRLKARVVDRAEKQAAAGRARKAGGTLVYGPDI